VNDRDDWHDGFAPTLAGSTFPGINAGSGTEISAPLAASGTVTSGTTGAGTLPADQAFTSSTTKSGAFATTEPGVSADTPDNNSAAAAPNTGDGLADIIVGGFGAVLLTAAMEGAIISAANAVPHSTKDGGNGNAIAGGHWAHCLATESRDDHFAFLSDDHAADRWRTSADFKPKSDRIDLTALGLTGFVILALDSASTSVPAHTIAWIYDGSADQTTVYVNSTDHSLSIGDTSLVEVHLQGMLTIEPSELALAPDQAVLLTAAERTEAGIATAHDNATAVAMVSTDTSSGATSEVRDKHTSQTSDPRHGPDTVQDRIEPFDHIHTGSIRDDESGKHLAATTSDDAPTAHADAQPSVTAQHALPTETAIAPGQPTFDKAEAPTNGGGAVPTPTYVVHIASTAAPDAPLAPDAPDAHNVPDAHDVPNTPDMPDVKADLPADEQGPALGHDWTHPSRDNWQFNFEWKNDGPAHSPDVGSPETHVAASMHGPDMFHFDLSSTTHLADDNMFGPRNSVHFNGEASAHSQGEDIPDHATVPHAHHASHDLMV
jgi:hypothetical protein